jgi:ATP-dependent helicase/nuclease subunit B
VTARAFVREAPRRLIVPNERAVEAAAAGGELAETRSSLVRRLLARLAPDVRFARGHEVRVALAQAMVMAAGSDAHLARLSAAGGATWLRTLDSLDRSIGKLRAAAVTPEALARVARSRSLAAGRARTLEIALRALDEQLTRAGLVDQRRAASVLIWALGKTDPSAVRTAVGAPELLARGLLHWEPVDLAAWRTLDEVLRAAATDGARGGARVELPSFAFDADAKLSAQRERDPLEIVFEEIARALDDAPETVPLESPLGDLRLAADPPAEASSPRIELVHASDTDATARVAADVVRRALEEGQSVDAVVIALTRSDAALAAALARSCDELQVVASFSPATGGGEEIEDAPGVVGVAMRALGCADRGLPAAEIAELARSAYVDPRLLAPSGERKELSRMARAFDETPRPTGSTALASLLGTVRAWHAARRTRAEEGGRGVTAEELAELAGDEEVTTRLASALLAGTDARTRVEHVASTRTLFAALGFERRVRGALVRRFADGGAADPRGVVERAELAARARDARGWERLLAGVDGYEAALARLGIAHLPASRETFRHELAQVITELGRGEAAARAGTLRVLTLHEVADEALDHLIVVDVAEGALPSATADDPFFPEVLEKDLGKGTVATRPTPPSVRRAVELGAFAVAVARARQTTLVHRGTDASGAALAPAPVFAWLARTRATIERWGSSPIARNPRSAHEITLKYLHQAEPGARALFRPELARRARVEDEREGFFLDPARTRSEIVGDSSGIFARGGELFVEALEAETGATRAIGVSDLERWAKCHFMGFTSTVLRVRERPRVREQLDPREAGTIIHEALAAAFRATAPAWSARPRDREALFDRAMSAANEVLTRQAASGLREIALSRARASVAQVVNASIDDERWDFALAEQPFGERSPGSWPALTFRDADGAQVILRGRLDRLDRAHRNADGSSPARILRVVDYKSSADKQATTALGESALQLPIYALAALAAVGDGAGGGQGGAADAAYLGYSTRERGTSEKKDLALAARLDELLDASGDTATVPQIARRALDLVNEGRRGDFLPTLTTAPCARCALDGICRKPRFVVPADSDEEASPE